MRCLFDAVLIGPTVWPIQRYGAAEKSIIRPRLREGKPLPTHGLSLRPIPSRDSEKSLPKCFAWRWAEPGQFNFKLLHIATTRRTVQPSAISDTGVAEPGWPSCPSPD